MAGDPCLVKPLVNLRTELNAICPNRDKSSDGWIGDYAHQQGDSDHNPDDTGLGNAGWDSDSDTAEEVRAIDLDRDLNEPGLKMEDVLAHLLKYCRNGTFWWVRYIIFDGYWYHINDGNYAKRTYTGSNPHDHHMHVSSQHSQSADAVNAYWRLEELVALTNDDKTWISQEIAKQVKAAIDNACELKPFASGGGDHSQIGDAVLNSSYPKVTGAQRTVFWGNQASQQMDLDDLQDKVGTLQSDVTDIKTSLETSSAS